MIGADGRPIYTVRTRNLPFGWKLEIERKHGKIFSISLWWDSYDALQDSSADR